MAVRTWNGQINSSWNELNNWDEQVVPVTDDEVLLDVDTTEDGVYAPQTDMDQSSVVLKRLAIGDDYNGPVGTEADPLVVGCQEILVNTESSGDIYISSFDRPDAVVNPDGTSDYTTIASAITGELAGAIVHVMPAGWASTDKYSETITINKNMTMKGIGNPIIDGGASGTTVTISGGVTVTLRGFTLQGGSAANGGNLNVNNSGGTATIQRCTIQDGTATSNGGGFILTAGTMTMEDCLIEDNSTTGGNRYGGGGRANASQTATFTRCKFNSNDAGWLGGGGIADFAGATYTNCTFTNNTAPAGGSAHGGGIWTNTAITCMNCTFMDNNANGNGKGVWCDGSNTNTFTNSIFWDNPTTDGVYLDDAGTVGNFTNCDIEGGTAAVGGAGTANDVGSSCINSDPLVLASGDDPYDLDDDSPCKDTGTNTGAPTNDIIFTARDTTSGTADIGAYEWGDSTTEQTQSAEYLYFEIFGDLYLTKSIETIYVSAECTNLYAQRGDLDLSKYSLVSSSGNTNFSYSESETQDLDAKLNKGFVPSSEIIVFGGDIDSEAYCNNITQAGGKWTQDTSDVTGTYDLNNGTLSWKGGDITTLKARASIITNESIDARTVTTLTMYPGCNVNLDDGAGSITVTNGITYWGGTIQVDRSKTIALS